MMTLYLSSADNNIAKGISIIYNTFIIDKIANKFKSFI